MGKNKRDEFFSFIQGAHPSEGMENPTPGSPGVSRRPRRVPKKKHVRRGVFDHARRMTRPISGFVNWIW